MRKNNEVIFKALVLILLFTILFITLVSNTNRSCELNKGILAKAFYNGKNIKGIKLSEESKLINNNEDSKEKNDSIDFKNDEAHENKLPTVGKKLLYYSRHEGTISNFSTIAKLLNFDVTVLIPYYEYDGRPNCFKEDKCKSYVEMMCNRYDYIVVSDIIPDSYIYLINPCKAKIILEITNRFDLFVADENKDDYLVRFGKAIMDNRNIIVVENNPFETYYACTKGVFIPRYYLIRPIGYAPPAVMHEQHNEVHDEIAFINHNDQDENYTRVNLENLGVKFAKLPHRYGGPLVLATYKAILMLPYQVSIMKMMENFRYGVAVILPSERLFKELLKDDYYYFAQKDVNDIEDGISKYVEFYNSEFKHLFVYFDKWEDIPSIIENTDFDAKKRQVKEFMEQYERKALSLWAEILDLSPSKHMIVNEKPLCENDKFYNY